VKRRRKLPERGEEKAKCVLHTKTTQHKESRRGVG